MSENKIALRRPKVVPDYIQAVDAMLGVKESTKKNYKRALVLLARYVNGNPLEYLKGKDPADISRILDQCIDRVPGIKQSTRGTLLFSMRSVVADALQIGLPKSKVSRVLSQYKPRKSTKYALSKEQVDKLKNYFEQKYKNPYSLENEKQINLRNLILVKLLAGTSQRVQDILNLTVEEAKKPLLHFKQQKTGNEGFFENPCIGEIHLYVNLVNLFPNDPLFAVGASRKRLCRTNAYSIISKAAALVLGVENVGPHCFRKYVVNRLLETGHTMGETKQVTLHGSQNMVEYYAENEDKPKNLKEIL